MAFSETKSHQHHSSNGDKDTANNGDIEKHEVTWKFWQSRRQVVAVLAFFGFFNVYALRVNLSIAILSMTNNKTLQHENGTEYYGREFDWDSKMKGYVLSSFFYGYITTQIIGGYVGAIIGGKKVYGLGIFVTSLLTVFTPWCANISVYLLIAVRIIEGIFEGVTYPCIHAVWSRWAPPLERSRLATLAFSGSYAGTVVAMPASAFLSTHFGWPSIFYCFGTLGIIWFIIWMVVVAESPSVDPKISKAELDYITSSLKDTEVFDRKKKYPWGDIVTSMPVWAIVVSHFSENWGFYTLLTQLPIFMKDILHFELESTGIMSAVPYFAMAVMIQFSGQFADWFQVKGILTTTQVRKVFNCGAFIAQTIFMMGAAYWLTPTGAMVCLTLSVGLGAFAWAGFSVNHLDIAPQYASVLMGFSNTFATLPGIISPILSGYIVTTPDASKWKIVFFISSGIYLFGAVIYGIFASGKVQPWAQKQEKTIDGQKNPAFENEEEFL